MDTLSPIETVREPEVESPVGESEVRHTSVSQFTGISIVIPFYNEATRIVTCLRAIRASREQLLPDDRAKIEVIVVDDHSPLPFPDIETPLTDTFHRLDRNMGVGAARNKGLALANKSHVLFLDADVVLDPTFLPLSFERLRERSDILILEGPHSVKPANAQPSLFQHYLAISWYEIMAKGLVVKSRSPCFYSACVIVNRDFFQEFGGFSEAYSSSGGEEFEVAARLSREAPDAIVFDETLISYHHFDSMGRRLRKLLRRSKNLTHTAGRISTIPFSFKCSILLRLLSGAVLLVCIPMLVIAPSMTIVAYVGVSGFIGLVDLRRTRYFQKYHSALLALVSLLFGQLEYACMGMGIFASRLRRR